MTRAAEIDAEWEQGEKERKARERATKRKVHYRKLRPLPRCCLSCRYGRFTEDYAVCYRIHYGEFGYPDIDHFGICDHWEAKRGTYA